MISVEISDNSSGSVLDVSSNSTVCWMDLIVVDVARAALLIPLYIAVLFHGLQRWRQHCSFNSASHSDIFTYHAAALEMIWFLATCLNVFGMPVPTPLSKTVLMFFIRMSWYGETFFNILTCIERYLAVVHPIVYMRLRNARGVRIRNISIACAWTLSAVYSCSNLLFHPQLILQYLVPLALCLAAVTFCSLTVLLVLIRPGPGDEGQGSQRVDKAKQRAFFTIAVISVVLWLWFGGIITSFSLNSTTLSSSTKCMVRMLIFLLNLPCASVLPLLYLHRVGILTVCGHKDG